MKFRILLLVAIVLMFSYEKNTPVLGALDIGMTPLALENLPDYESRSVSERISSSISSVGSGLAFNIPLISEGPSEEPPNSLVAAGEWIAFHGLDILVYGKIVRIDSIVDATINIYSEETDRIVRMLYARDDVQNMDRLLEDISDKVYNYFAEELGFSSTTRIKDPRLGVWRLRVAGGWWKPVGQWSPYLSSLALGELGISMIPVRPVSRERKLQFYMSFGLMANYSIGLNPAHLEKMVFQGIQARMPVDLIAEWSEHHQFRFTLSGIFQVDMVALAPLYKLPSTKTYYAGGVGIAFSYALKLGNSLVGIGNNLDIIFYDTPRVVYTPVLFYEYSFSN